MTKAKTTPPAADDKNQAPPNHPENPESSGSAPSDQEKEDILARQQAQIDQLMKTVNDLHGLLAKSVSNTDVLQQKLKEQNDQMAFIAGRVKNDEWENKKKAGKGARIVRLRKHNGQFVVGWSKMTENWASNKNPNKVWQESLRTTLYLEDGSKEEVDYAAFSVNCEFEDAEVLKTSVIDSPIEGASPDVTFTVKTKDGKELILNSRFVN